METANPEGAVALRTLPTEGIRDADKSDERAFWKLTDGISRASKA